MKHVALVLGIGVALAACHHKTMDEGLSEFVGKPVTDAYGKIGYPNAEQKVPGGRKAYLWSKGERSDCTVRMVVDEKEIVVASDFQGTNHGCAAYLKALRRG